MIYLRRIIDLQSRLLVLMLVGLFLLPAICAGQDYLPRRKSGLWEMNEISSYFPGISTRSKYCVDSKQDRLDLEMRNLGGVCSPALIRVDKRMIEIEKECLVDNSKAKSTAVIRGDLTRRYEATYLTVVSPPRRGITELRGQVTATYLGNCEPGQNAGDIVFKDGQKMNMIKIRDPGPLPIIKGQ